MGKVVSIHSFRGGTGKSNVCANLAAQAALAGHRVAIVDTDIASPGIHVIFGLDENNMGRTLNEYLSGGCSIQEVAYPVGEQSNAEEGCKKLAGKSLWLIPSSIKGADISKVLKEGYDIMTLNKGFRGLQRELNLDYLFIDTHPGLNEETLLSFAITDILVVILRPDQQDFQGTAVTVDIARSLDVPNLKLLVNKIPSRYNLEQARREIGQRYDCAVIGALPLSEDLADLGSKDLFSLRYPNHPWSHQLRQAADAILTTAG